MNSEDLKKTIEFIEGAYSKKLNDNEIKVLIEELKDIIYQQFYDNIRFPLLKKVDYFTVANLHKIIEEYRDLEKMKQDLGIKDFDELYEN